MHTLLTEMNGLHGHDWIGMNGKSRARSDGPRILDWRNRCRILALVLLMLIPNELRAVSLHAELAFLFDCEGKTHSEVEEATEKFLAENGFDVLNVTRIRRENKLTPMQPTIFIDSLDSLNRVIRVMEIPLTGKTYSFGLITPPTTPRSKDIEAKATEFISSKLGCQIRDLERKENRIESTGLFETFLKEIKTNFLRMKGLGKT